MQTDGLRPDWPVSERVGALMTTRHGGVSRPPWRSLNLGLAVGDEPQSVHQNRALFAASLGATPVYLTQVHGAAVVHIDAEMAARGHSPLADAAITTAPGVACTVLVADCLPVLFASPHGRAVAAAHAGWRGLAAGVLEATLAGLCEAAQCRPAEVAAWLGPCIGPRQFEVGQEVLDACAASACAEDRGHFVSRMRPDGQQRWLADLAQLAAARLRRQGVRQIDGGRWCTVEDGSDFFSFRRAGITGRQAAAVWIRP